MTDRPAPQPDPDILKKIHSLRIQVRESFGQVVMAIMNPARATGISRWAT